MTEISPASGAKMPRIVFKSVLLPAPFGPMRPTISPAVMPNETFSKITCRS